MSKFLTPRNLAIAGGLGAAVYFFPRTRQAANPVGNVFETPGVKNIGERYAAQGGTETHMPGVATPRGSVEKQTPPQEKLNGTTSGKFQDRIADQKTDTNFGGKALGSATLGSAPTSAHDHEAHGTTAAKLVKNAAPGSLAQSLPELLPPAKPSSQAQKEAEHPTSTEELNVTKSDNQHGAKRDKHKAGTGKGGDKAAHGGHGKDKGGKHT